MPGVDLDWILNKVILLSTALLLGQTFTHWICDYSVGWVNTGARGVAPEAIEGALRYYSHVYNSPPFYVTTLTVVAGLAIGSALLKIILNPVNGLLFDGATLLLLGSAASVYSANIVSALRYLPLEIPAGSTFSAAEAIEKAHAGLGGSLNGLGEIRLVEALQSVAASHLILAVSLTGVLALQGAQGWADRPERSSTVPMGVFPPTDTAPVPVKGEKNPEKGLHAT